MGGSEDIVAANAEDGLRPSKVPAPAGHGYPERTVNNSNWEIQKFVANRNALWVVGNIISNVVVRSMLTMVCHLVEPVDEEHGQAISSGHTPRGAVEWHMQMARGKMRYLSQELLVLKNRIALAEAGLITGCPG